MTEYKRYHLGEWAALYADGRLDTYGDAYIIDERIAELLGVKDEWNESIDFTLGTNSDPAETVQQIEEWVTERDRIAAEQEAAELEQEALALLDRAAKYRDRAKELLKQ